MATGTNGIATVNDLVVGKGLSSPAAAGYSDNQCPTKEAIMTHMGGAVSGTYSLNQLVKYSDVSKTIDGVLFTVTIDNRNSSVGANLNIANRAAVAPGTYAFRTVRQVGYATGTGVTNHNTGPFIITEPYGNSNVLYWAGSAGFNYSYTAIVGTSGTTYSTAGSGTYNGSNPGGGGEGRNLEYITLFSQSIKDKDSISLTMIIY